MKTNKRSSWFFNWFKLEVYRLSRDKGGGKRLYEKTNRFLWERQVGFQENKWDTTFVIMFVYGGAVVFLPSEPHRRFMAASFPRSYCF